MRRSPSVPTVSDMEHWKVDIKRKSVVIVSLDFLHSVIAGTTSLMLFLQLHLYVSCCMNVSVIHWRAVFCISNS